MESTTAITAGDASGRLVYFGVRENAMGSIMNGMAVSGTLPFGGTFFVFSDYMRPAARLAAIQRAKVAFVWTHDSDRRRRRRSDPPADRAARRDPRHPASARDPSRRRERGRAGVAGAHRRRRSRPRSCSRANPAPSSKAPRSAPRPVSRNGAYVLAEESRPEIDLVLIGTGSEVVDLRPRRDALAGEGLSVRLVSMPSWDLFEARTRRRTGRGAAARCSHARGRGRFELRMVEVRGRRGLDRSVRRVGTRCRRARTIRLHARARRRPGPCACSASPTPRPPCQPRRRRREQDREAEPDRQAAAVRAEPLVRQPDPRVRHRRPARADGARRHPRRHVEPHHLREGAGRGQRLRRAAPVGLGGRHRHEGRVLGARHHRHRERGRPAAAGVRLARRRRRVRVGGGRPRPRAQHRRHREAGGRAVRQGRPPQRDDQDPGYGRVPPRDHRDHCRGDQRERHPDLRVRRGTPR